MRVHRFALAVFVTLLLGGQAAYGFDCSKAAAPMDFVICSSPEAYAANEEMAEAWRGTREDLNEGGRATLVADQRAWMEDVSRDCGLPARGRPKQEVVLAAQSCVIRAIRERIPDIVRASTKFNFSMLQPAIDRRCSPETGEASIRVGSEEDEDAPSPKFPLLCQLAPVHRLQIDWDATSLGEVQIRADDTLIGTSGYFGNHIMSLRDLYVSARIETKGEKSKLVADVMDQDNNCTRYSLDGPAPAETEDYECDSANMPPLHVR